MDNSEPAIVTALLSRRSIRDGYLTRAIPRGVLIQVVRCGLAAPASKAASPWRFTVVDRRDRLAGIADDVATAPEADVYTPHDPSTGRPIPRWTSTVEESAAVLRLVPAAIFIENRGPFSGGRQSLLRATPAARELAMVGYELELAGLGAAVQSMWMAALAFGLSAVFMGDVAVAERAIATRLGLGGDLIGALALGYASAQQRSPRDRELDPELVRWDSEPK